VGLTIAPIMPIPQWRDGYRRLLQDVAIALSDVPDVDLTVECITHRFTAGSKDVLLGWYPRIMRRWTSRHGSGSSANTAPPNTSTRKTP
jgi:DNA repair photolyase